MKQRFTKDRAIKALLDLSDAIAAHEKFDRNNGTSQFRPKGRMSDEGIRRAVEYGRMQALDTAAHILESL